MTTGLLIIVHVNYLGLRHMNHGLTDCIFLFPLFRLVSGNLIHLGYIRFSQKLVWSLAKRRLCLGPAGVINCTPLSTLSFWVSLFPERVAATVALSVPLLMSTSEAFSVRFYTSIKLCYTKALEWSRLVLDLKAKSSSEIMNLTSWH